MVTRKSRASSGRNPSYFIRACLGRQYNQASINSHIDNVEKQCGNNFLGIVSCWLGPGVAEMRSMKSEPRIGIECSLNSAKKRESARGSATPGRFCVAVFTARDWYRIPGLFYLNRLRSRTREPEIFPPNATPAPTLPPPESSRTIPSVNLEERKNSSKTAGVSSVIAPVA